MTKKSPHRLRAEELCREFPASSSLSLARKVYNEFKETFNSLDSARTLIRTIRGAKGEKQRKLATSPRPLGKAGQKLECPESFCEEWTPYVLRGASRVGVISDLHIPYHSKPAIEAAVYKLRRNKIDTLVINGDYADFYRMSRFEQDPRNRSFGAERVECVRGLAWLRQQFPKVTIVYKLGNHDERYDKMIWQRAPELFDVPQCQLESLLEFAKYKIISVRDQRPIMAGKLPILHGHELARGFAAPVNPARGAFMKTLHSVLVGHHHRTSTHVEPDMFGREIAVWSTGMLCYHHPSYNRFCKCNWGFAFVEVFSNKEFSVENYRISNDWKVRTG